ncbi:HupE/UreJ family protein, partial [Kaarinaea lacus]
LHGFGFAGALAEVGLPQQAIPLALVFFNVGVELGQLIFVGVVLSSGWLIHRIKAFPLRPAEMVTTYVIGSIAAFWTIERVAGFWG